MISLLSATRWFVSAIGNYFLRVLCSLLHIFAVWTWATNERCIWRNWCSGWKIRLVLIFARSAANFTNNFDWYAEASWIEMLRKYFSSTRDFQKSTLPLDYQSKITLINFVTGDQGLVVIFHDNAPIHKVMTLHNMEAIPATQLLRLNSLWKLFLYLIAHIAHYLLFSYFSLSLHSKSNLKQ